MAALNRGIRIDSSTTDLFLNNRLFEDPQGSLLLNARVEKPTGHSGTVEKVLLTPGANTSGYLEISIIYQDDGFRYKASSLGIQSDGTFTKGLVSSTSNVLGYDQEITLGVVYNANSGVSGGLISLRTSADNQTLAEPVGATFGPITQAPSTSKADTPASIGLADFKGFIGKLATFNTMIPTASPNSLETYVNDPESWPTTNLVHFLDGTQVRAQPGQDNSLAETQRIEFGPAGRSGFINVGGVQIFVRAGDSASTVADSVKTGLEADALYKPQAEKQQITVGAYTGGNTSFKVDGVDVNLTGNTTKEALASAIASALQDAYSIGEKSGRFVNVHSDDVAAYVTVTFGPTESNGNPPPLTIDSLASGLPLSVEDVLTFSANGLSRTVTKDGSNALLVTFKPADGNVNDFTITNGTTYPKIRINPGSTGVTVSASESKAATPSEFDFVTKVLGEEQTISITQLSSYTGLFSTIGGLGGGSFTISNTGINTNATVVVSLANLTSQTQIATAVRDALNSTTSSADSFISSASLGTDGKSVVVNFKPSAKNALELTVASTDPVAIATVQTTGEFARNARGEVQKVTFGPATSAASFTFDGVTVTPASTSQTSTQIAAAVKKALEEKTADAYSLAEIHSFQFKSGATANGTLIIPSVTIATDFTSTQVDVLVASGDSAATVATKVATALAGAGAGFQSAEADGDTVHIKYANAVRNPTNGFTIDSAGLTTTGITYEPKTDTRDFDVAGKRKITEDGSGGLTIEFNAAEGDVAPLVFNGTGSSVTASVATVRKAHTVDLTTSGYTGSVSTEGAAPSNVLYAQLVRTESGRDDLGALRTTKDVVFDIYLDPAYASLMEGGYESVSFKLNYPTVDVASSFRPIVDLPDTTASRGSSVYNVNTESGDITISWIDSVSVTDFKKPIATVTLKQQAVSGAYNPSLNLSFTNVGIDNVDFTDGTTFTASFADSINTNRWDVSSRLVNALDNSNSIGIGNQRLLYAGEESSPSSQLALTINHADVDAFFEGLAPTALGLTWGFAVITNQAATRSVAFTLELPTQALDAGAQPLFTPSAAATAAGFTVSSQSVTGRTMKVEMATTQAGGLSVGSSLGLLSIPVTNASDKSLEIAFAPGSTSINTQAVTGSSIYFGHTLSKVSSSSADRGNWTAPDMPQGTFFKEFIATAPTNATRVVTAADALQILKLSAGSNIDWLGTPSNASLVAADTDGNGKITAQDALVALRYSNGTLPSTGDPMKWTFIDGATTGLSLSNAKPASSMNQGMPIDASVGTVRIDANTNPSYWVKALLVGNLTSPTGAEYIS
jgi:galactitol-specific phosphotransferase system IIB component